MGFRGKAFFIENGYCIACLKCHTLRLILESIEPRQRFVEKASSRVVVASEAFLEP